MRIDPRKLITLTLVALLAGFTYSARAEGVRPQIELGVPIGGTAPVCTSLSAVKEVLAAEEHGGAAEGYPVFMAREDCAMVDATFVVKKVVLRVDAADGRKVKAVEAEVLVNGEHITIYLIMDLQIKGEFDV